MDGAETKPYASPEIGDAVHYVDEYGKVHNALVLNVFNFKVKEQQVPNPSINLVFVSSDENKTDGYGRQKEHRSSLCHASSNTALGNYWKRPEEPQKV